MTCVAKSALDFVDIALLDDKAKQEAASESEDRIVDFVVKELQFVRPVKRSVTDDEEDGEIMAALKRWARQELPAANLEEEMIAKTIKVAYDLVVWFYPLASAELKLLMGRLTAIATSLDDHLNDEQLAQQQVGRFSSSDDDSDDLQHHGVSQPKASGWLALYSSAIEDLVDYFGRNDALAARLVRASGTDFLLGCLIEQRMAGHDKTALPREQQGEGEEGSTMQPVHFPYYLRNMTGFSTAYLLPIFGPHRHHDIDLMTWMTSIPDIQCYINVANDVLSLPKELLAGETTTFFGQTAQMGHAAARPGSGHDGLYCMRDVLEEQCKAVTEAIRRVDAHMATLDQDKAVLWSAFRHGYLAWHLECPRYGLTRAREQVAAKADVQM